MTLREDDNNKSRELTNSLQTLDNEKVDFSAQCGIIITVEGLMLGAAPATVKAVKASSRRVLNFTAAGADAASQVAAAQSKLDGALQACALVGVDPANVATVANLQHALLTAQGLVDTDASAAVLTIEVMTLHKRGYKNS